MLAVLAYLAGVTGTAALLTGYAAEDMYALLARLTPRTTRPAWALNTTAARRYAHTRRHPLTSLKCPACPRQRNRGNYLCLTCWRTLSAITRGRLARRDPRAFLRLRELHGQIAARTPLPDIKVSQ